MEIEEESSVKPLRNTKDTVFSDLFSEPDYLFKLYKTLHPDDDIMTEKDLELVTLQKIIANGIHNDLGFLAKDKLLILVEAQSTWSPNIVLRSLMYLFSTYQQYLSDRDIYIYGPSPVEIPMPEVYVVYTGEKKNHPDILSLQKIYFDGKDCCIDFKVKVIYLDNSNTIIDQYIMFSMIWTEQIKMYGLTKKAVMNTIRICMKKKYP